MPTDQTESPVQSPIASSTYEAGYDATKKQKSEAKTSRIPIKVVAAERLK